MAERITGKRLNSIFENRVAPSLKVTSTKNGVFTDNKKEVYFIDEGYGGYRLSKRLKNSSAESDISERYSGKEMKAYLKGMEDGIDIKSKKR